MPRPWTSIRGLPGHPLAGPSHLPSPPSSFPVGFFGPHLLGVLTLTSDPSLTVLAMPFLPDL